MSRLRSTSLALGFSVSLLALVGAGTAFSDEWSLTRSGEEMWVYTRDRAGSDIKEVRLEMLVDAPIAAINAVLDDAARQPEWVYKCVEARDLGGDIATGWHYYSRIDMPWPLEDRDVVARVVGGLVGDTYTSTSTAAPTRAPHVEGCVRLTDFDVRTEYRATEDGRTRVTYQLHSEPGGNVPSWLVNLFVDRGPVETMTRLRSLVESEAARAVADR